MKMNEVVNTAEMTTWISDHHVIVAIHAVVSPVPDDFPDGCFIVSYTVGTSHSLLLIL